MKTKIGPFYLLLLFLALAVTRTTFAQAKPNLMSNAPSIAVEAMVDGKALTASEIFSQVSPSVAFIETPSGFGSSVLIEGAYLLTNAHVVYPYDHVRVVFPDGSEFRDVPVHAWDLMVDLALVGPIDVSFPPLTLVDGSDLEIGSDLYLVGYPTEVDSFPQPTITKGILSRIRHWNVLDLSLFQTDATLIGGQSGGVLTTQQGEVIGISTFTWDGFGLAISIGDALPRLEAMLAQDLELSLGTRRIVFAESSSTHEGVLRHDYDEKTYLLFAPAGTEVDVRVDSTAIPYISIVDGHGYAVVDSHFKGETGAVATFKVLTDAPLYVQVTQALDYEAPFSLTASHALAPFDDPDDGTMLTRGQAVLGSLDTPLDFDHYEVYLNANELVEISVDSLGTQSMLILHYMGSDREEVLIDGFSGGGVFGENDRIVYRAPASGVHLLSVELSGDSAATGGYFLSLAAAEPDTKPSVVQVSKQLVDMPAGLMALYESQDYALEMLYPFDPTAALEEECLYAVETFCANGLDLSLIVTERDLAFVPETNQQLSKYVDYLLINYEFDAPGFELINRQEITTVQGLTGESFTFYTNAGLSIGAGVAFMDEANSVAFDAFYLADSEEEYERMEPLFAESFASYRSWEGEIRRKSPIHFLDQGFRQMTGGDTRAARRSFSKAIELDPDLISAYVQRAYVHSALNDTAGMVADMEQAISLAPDEPTLPYYLAELLYYSFEYEDARNAIDEAIGLDPFDPDLYFLSAKIAALQDDESTAFSDLNDASLLTHGFMPWDAWETLGFLYLIVEDFEEAVVHYESLLTDVPDSPHVLLGIGICYAKLDKDDSAVSLLEEAMLAAENLGPENDPQLLRLYDMAKEVKRELTD